MNNRQLMILSELIYSNSGMTIEEISSNFDVSHRTVRTDLKSINSYLIKNNYPIISKKSSNRWFIDINIAFTNLLKQLNLSEYDLNKQERIKIESAIIILSNKFITYDNLANILLASRSTIISDQKELCNLLESHGLEFNSKPGVGLSIEGSEINIRDFIISTFKNDVYLQILIVNSINEDELSLGDIDKIVSTICDIISEAEFQSELILSDLSFIELTNYLIFIYLRISVNRDLLTIPRHRHITTKKIKNLSLNLKDLIEYKLKIEVNSNEISYLFNIIDNLNFKNITNQDNDSLGIQFMTSRLIDLVSNNLSIPLYLDYNLFESLSLHLERMSDNNYDDIIEFPEVNSIVENNQEIFKSVKSFSYLLSEYFKREISKIEIAYIAVYIVASIDRIINIESKNIKVLLVCNAGIGTSQLLASKLDKIFDLIIKDSTNSHQIANYDLDDIDLIISTVNLTNVGRDFIKVSPLISEKDYKNISVKIKEISERKIYQLKELPTSIRSNKKFINTPRGEGIDYYLTEENIMIDVEASDWKDSIVKASTNLLDKGFITKYYIDDMIENIETYGPYIVISEGFALPHAQVSEHVSKTSFSLVRLKNPVNYGSYEFDPIKYVCVLAVDKNKNHMAALFELINLLSFNEFKKKLDYATTSEQIANIISSFKQEYITNN